MDKQYVLTVPPGKPVFDTGDRGEAERVARKIAKRLGKKQSVYVYYPNGQAQEMMAALPDGRLVHRFIQ